jgi:hypothetical protein
VLGITLYSHRDLEIVLGGFNVAYNGRRQRVLDGLSPEMVLRQRLEADPALANPSYRPPKPGLLRKALRVVEDAKEVSHPDTGHVRQTGSVFCQSVGELIKMMRYMHDFLTVSDEVSWITP